MKSTHTSDAILEWVTARSCVDAAFALCRQAFKHDKCAQSDLEAVMGLALRAVAAVETQRWPVGEECPLFHDGTDPGRLLTICCQHRIENYRADFVVWSQQGVVVEVDGHDFHERTKEQAQRDKSRDRLFQRLGFRVFRFTGSEVWRNPIACAQESILAAMTPELR